MHEVSIAEGILDVVERTARANDIAAVGSIRVAVGELAGVDIPSLMFAWESVRKGSVAATAELVLDRPPGRAWCMTCGKDVPLKRYGDPCPTCGSYQLMATGGTELRVVDFTERVETPEGSSGEASRETTGDARA